MYLHKIIMFHFTHHIYFSDETIFKCYFFFGGTATVENFYGYNLITIPI